MKTVVMNITPHLKLMAEKNGSDLFLTIGAQVSIKINGEMCPINRAIMEPGLVKHIAYSMMNEKQVREFEQTREMNLGLPARRDLSLLRVNLSTARRSLHGNALYQEFHSFHGIARPSQY
jgi:twitching motility protein PilU